jgi:hypothetical protein
MDMNKKQLKNYIEKIHTFNIDEESELSGEPVDQF